MKKNKSQWPPRILAYLRVESAHCKPSTIYTYGSELHHFAEYLRKLFRTKKISRKQIAALKKSHIENYFSLLREKNLAPYTQFHYLFVLRKYLSWEVQEGTLGEGILEALAWSRLPRVPEYLPRPLSSENDSLLTHRLRESNSPYAPLFLLLRQTGLRISELIHLPWNPIITTAQNEKYLKVPLGKMNNERLVPLSDECLLIIEKIQSLFPIRKGSEDPHHLIGIKGSTSFLRGHLSRQFRKIHEGMMDQGKSITFHRLRHTYATTLLTGGVSLASLMKLLGHRKIEMTLRYAKVIPSHLRDEYLKALRVLQQQSGLKHQKTAASSCQEIHPAEILDPLVSFLTKSALIDPLHRKNLLLRLRRLQQELLKMSFSQKFKPIFSGETL
jgi:site-specific recombinase XerD